MKKSINKKLAAGFGFCLLLIISVVGFNYIALGELKNFYQETLGRSVNMELATDAQHIGDDMYEVIANAVINRDMAKSDKEWAVTKKVSLEKLRKVAAVCESQEEQVNVREAERALNDIIRIYEQEMLPLIRKGASVPGPLSAIDAQIDKRNAAIDFTLAWVAKSMSGKNRQAERKFNSVLNHTHGFGLIISVAGILAIIIIITLATRQIVRPLEEITTAALEIKKGNFLVELKHHSDDEIGVLSDAFRDMSGQVKKRTAELQTSNELLQQEISERRQVEAEISRLNAQLEVRVAERTAELVQSNEQRQRVIIAQRQTEDELRSSREELRSLAAYQQSVREEDRKRISREIHDELGQSLTALKLDISWLGKKLCKDQTALCEKTGSMTELIESVIQTVQRISSDLRPGMLDELGLKEAMEWEMKRFQDRTGIACELSFDPTDFNGNMESRITLFRIFQEALTNVARHSQATKLSVILEVIADILTLSIQDNGRGITDEEISDPKSLGLLGIRERARLCGGEVKIRGSRHEGTMVKVIIPLDRKEVPR